jgi:hypothetical protein
MTAAVYMHVPGPVQAEAVQAVYDRRQARKKTAKRATAKASRGSRR